MKPAVNIYINVPSICAGQSGFTLIEVIAASLILFTALTVAAVSYNASLDFADRSQAITRISGAVFDIRDLVKTKLEAGQIEGVDSLSQNISYAWQAQLKKSSLNILRYDDEFAGGISYGNFKLDLFNVELIITLIAQGKEQQSHYDYIELIWTEQ